MLQQQHVHDDEDEEEEGSDRIMDYHNTDHDAGLLETKAKQVVFHTVKALQSTRDHLKSWTRKTKDQTQQRYEQMQDKYCGNIVEAINDHYDTTTTTTTTQENDDYYYESSSSWCIPKLDLSWKEKILCRDLLADHACQDDEEEDEEDASITMRRRMKRLSKKAAKLILQRPKQYIFDLRQDSDGGGEGQSTTAPPIFRDTAAAAGGGIFPAWSAGLKASSDWAAGVAIPKPSPISSQPSSRRPRSPTTTTTTKLRDGGHNSHSTTINDIRKRKPRRPMVLSRQYKANNNNNNRDDSHADGNNDEASLPPTGMSGFSKMPIHHHRHPGKVILESVVEEEATRDSINGNANTQAKDEGETKEHFAPNYESPPQDELGSDDEGEPSKVNSESIGEERHDSHGETQQENPQQQQQEDEEGTLQHHATGDSDELSLPTESSSDNSDPSKVSTESTAEAVHGSHGKPQGGNSQPQEETEVHLGTDDGDDDDGQLSPTETLKSEDNVPDAAATAFEEAAERDQQQLGK